MRRWRLQRARRLHDVRDGGVGRAQMQTQAQSPWSTLVVGDAQKHFLPLFASLGLSGRQLGWFWGEQRRATGVRLSGSQHTMVPMAPEHLPRPHLQDTPWAALGLERSLTLRPHSNGEWGRDRPSFPRTVKQMCLLRDQVFISSSDCKRCPPSASEHSSFKAPEARGGEGGCSDDGVSGANWGT